jgi:hypothetical protein
MALSVQKRELACRTLYNGPQKAGKKYYKWKPLGTQTAGRPKHRREDDVMEDLQLPKIKNWAKSIQNREEWRRIVEKVKTFIE